MGGRSATTSRWAHVLQESNAPLHARVPVHFLGLSQIASYGLLFYVFAQIAEPLSARYQVTPAFVLLGVSFILCIQAPLAPFVGSWVDRYGALRILSCGLALGGVGLAALGWFDHLFGFWLCMGIIGLGSAASQYEVAFAAAVQIHDLQSRHAISVITFYGGVASSIIWLSVAPLLNWFHLELVLVILAIPLGILSLIAWQSASVRQTSAADMATRPWVGFHWRQLRADQQRALRWLALSGSLEGLVFAATSLMWITWFTRQFNDPGLAVLLASLYGPFQVVGRILEMRFGRQHDARMTGLLAFLCLPISLCFAMIPSEVAAVMAMILFGMGHGVLSITFGFVISLFFEAGVYGRAKALVAAPKALAASAGPLLAGLLYSASPDWFLPAALLTISIALVVYLRILKLPTRASHPIIATEIP